MRYHHRRHHPGKSNRQQPCRRHIHAARVVLRIRLDLRSSFHCPLSDLTIEPSLIPITIPPFHYIYLPSSMIELIIETKSLFMIKMDGDAAAVWIRDDGGGTVMGS